MCIDITIHRNTTLLAPTAVKKVSAMALNSESIRVSWDRPEFSNGRISAYTVGYKYAYFPYILAIMCYIPHPIE